MITVEFTKTGQPHRFNNGLSGLLRGLTIERAQVEAYALEPLVLKFNPIMVKARVINLRPDGSRDIVTNQSIMLSNDCGVPGQIRYYNLMADGKVRYHLPDEDITWTFNEWVYEMKSREPDVWAHNVPTWRQFCYAESRQASLTFLMCWKQLRTTTMKSIDRPIATIIAKLVYASYADPAWHSRHKNS